MAGIHVIFPRLNTMPNNEYSLYDSSSPFFWCFLLPFIHFYSFHFLYINFCVLLPLSAFLLCLCSSICSFHPLNSDLFTHTHTDKKTLNEPNECGREGKREKEREIIPKTQETEMYSSRKRVKMKRIEWNERERRELAVRDGEKANIQWDIGNRYKRSSSRTSIIVKLIIVSSKRWKKAAGSCAFAKFGEGGYDYYNTTSLHIHFILLYYVINNRHNQRWW